MPIRAVTNVSYSTAQVQESLGHTWPPLHRRAFRDDKHSTIQDARSSQACNYSSSDQHLRGVRKPANQGTEFKEDKEAQKCPLDSKISEQRIKRGEQHGDLGFDLLWA